MAALSGIFLSPHIHTPLPLFSANSLTFLIALTIGQSMAIHGVSTTRQSAETRNAAPNGKESLEAP